MTSADFCPITPGIAPRRAMWAWLPAALFARMGWQHSLCAQACSTSGLTGHLCNPASHGSVGQISPDKNVNCGCTTAAFTLSPEPGASLCCANLPGDWALYAISVPFDRLRTGSGSQLCAPASFGHRLTATPLPSASTYVNDINH
jgi:hypothetical protein